MAFSSSNSTSARALQSSVLPTPVGPRKMNEPIGRLGSCRPERLRRTALATASTASSWPTSRWWSRSSSTSSLARSVSTIRVTGNAGPGADDLGDLLGADFLTQQPLGRLVGRASAVLLGCPRCSSCSASCLPLDVELVEPLIVAPRTGCPADCFSLIAAPAGSNSQLDLVELLADLLHVARGRSSPPPTARGGWPASCASSADLLLDLGQPLLGVLLGLVGQLPGGQFELHQPPLHLVDLARARSPAPSPAGWWPRPSGRWPCRAGTGRRCSGARGWPRPPGPSP